MTDNDVKTLKTEVMMVKDKTHKFLLYVESKAEQTPVFLIRKKNQPLVVETLLAGKSYQWAVAGVMTFKAGAMFLIQESTKKAVTTAAVKLALRKFLTGDRQNNVPSLRRIGAAKFVVSEEEFEQQAGQLEKLVSAVRHDLPQPKTTTDTETSTESGPEIDLKLYGAMFSGFLHEHNVLKGEIEQLRTVLKSKDDPVLEDIADNQLKNYLKAYEGVLVKLTDVSTAETSGMEAAIGAAKLAIAGVLQKLEEDKARIQAMEKAQPSDGYPVSFEPYRVKINAVLNYLNIL